MDRALKYIRHHSTTIYVPEFEEEEEAFQKQLHSTTKPSHSMVKQDSLDVSGIMLLENKVQWAPLTLRPRQTDTINRQILWH